MRLPLGDPFNCHHCALPCKHLEQIFVSGPYHEAHSAHRGEHAHTQAQKKHDVALAAHASSSLRSIHRISLYTTAPSRLTRHRR